MMAWRNWERKPCKWMRPVNPFDVGANRRLPILGRVGLVWVGGLGVGDTGFPFSVRMSVTLGRWLGECDPYSALLQEGCRVVEIAARAGPGRAGFGRDGPGGDESTPRLAPWCAWTSDIHKI